MKLEAFATTVVQPNARETDCKRIERKKESRKITTENKIKIKMKIEKMKM